MSTSYHLENIRTLLIEGFTDEELRTLCFDNFRDVHHQLAHNSGKTQIVGQLLEYCHRTVQIERLLALAEARNQARFEMHKPYFQTVTGPVKSPSKNPSDDSQALIESGMGAEPASFPIHSISSSTHSSEPEPALTKLPQIPSPQPIQPELLPQKSAGCLRDPIWQMIGVVVAVIGVLVAVIGIFWAIYTFYASRTILVTPDSTPTPFTPTSITQTIFTPTPIPTATDTPMTIPTPTTNPEPTNTSPPMPSPTNSLNTDAVAAATAMTPVVGYPCEAEIISSTGSNIVNTVRENASGTASIVVNKPLAVKTIVLIYDKRIEKDGVWYEVWIDPRNKVGYLPPENLLLYKSCPK